MSFNVSQINTMQSSSMSASGNMHSSKPDHCQSAPMFPPDSGANGDCGMGGQNSQSNGLLQDLMKLVQDVMGIAGKAAGASGGMMG